MPVARTYHPLMSVDVEVDRDVCIGSGHCIIDAPGAFELDEDGISFVVDATAVSEDTILATARKCPSQAISVWRDGTKLH
jgi:ferredoxin